MKKITLLVIMIVTAFTLNAQSLVKYQALIYDLTPNKS